MPVLRLSLLCPLFGWIFFALASARAIASPLVVEIPDEIERFLPLACRELLPLVVTRNERLLDVADPELCAGIPDRGARESCQREVGAAAHASAVGPITVLRADAAPEAGRDWPNRDRVSRFVSIEARLPVEKVGRHAEREISLLCFASATASGEEICLFPASHWYWSGLELPDRFAAAPLGACGAARVLSVTEYLREVSPPRESLWAIRFLSRAEADAWASRDPERIRHRGAYNRDHEYAKFFLVGSLLWWRGSRPEAPRPEYAYAVRLPELPLDRVLALERAGHAFLNIFEGGRAIELTLVDRAALVAALEWAPELLRDASGEGARGPELVPYTPEKERTRWRDPLGPPASVRSPNRRDAR